MNRYLSHHLHLQTPAASLVDADGSMTGEELSGSNKENNYLSGENSAENGSLNLDHQPMHETSNNIDGGRHCDEYCQQTTPGGVSPPKMPSHNPGALGMMMRPVARRPPSALEPPAPPGIKSGPLLLRPQHRQQQCDSSIGHDQPSFRPSGLRIALDLAGYGDTDILPNNPQLDVGACAPRNYNPIPQLPMRPILTNKELKMPSPLARRGPAERAYLQGQLKAEAQRRRKQEQHNNERRQRCSWQEGDGSADHYDGTNAMTDTDIQSMIEKFKFGFGDMGVPPNKLKFLPKKKNSRNNLPEFGAASPPAILKKTFKRSVSAVLEDSGIDEDGNLLFFPDGGPLLEVENEQSPHPLTEFADCVATSSRTTSPNSQDNYDPQEGGSVSCGADDNKSDDVDAAPSPGGGFILSPQESTFDSEEDELSPSLIAADVIWQLGAVTIDDAGLSMPTNKEHHKKVTLRPKTNAPQNNITNTPQHGQFKPIDGSHSSDSIVSLSGLGGLGVPSSENDVVAQANTSASDGEDPPLPPFKFETPDKFYSFKGDKLGGSKSFQQLSFEESENRLERRERTHTDGSNDSGKHSSSSFVFASPDAAGFNYQTPDNSFNDRHSYRSKQGFKGLVSMALDASLRGESSSNNHAPSSGLAGNQLDSFSFCTPDNSEHRRSFRRQLSERMPKLPELGICLSLDDSFHNDTLLKPFQAVGRASRAIEMTMERDAAFSGEIETNGLLLKEPLSESNFCTPDNSFHEKKPFPKFGLDDIPSLPSLGMMNQNGSFEQMTQAASLHHRLMENRSSDSLGPISTPC